MIMSTSTPTPMYILEIYGWSNGEEPKNDKHTKHDCGNSIGDYEIAVRLKGVPPEGDKEYAKRERHKRDC